MISQLRDVLVAGLALLVGLVAWIRHHGLLGEALMVVSIVLYTIAMVCVA